MSQEVTVRAIVLRRRDQGESDRRLTLFSLELGKIDVLAKGARKVTSRLKSVSEPLAVATFTFAPGKKQRFITQAQPEAAFRGLRTDFDRLNMGISWGEVVSAVIPYEEPLEEAFDLCEQVLKVLEVHQKPEVALAWGEVKLLEISGFLPSFASCTLSGDGVKESEVFLSPSAGGYVSREEAGNYRDRFLARAEVLYGLDALSRTDTVPKNLKFAAECLQALHPFWLHVCEAPLPARTQMLASLNAGLM